MAADFGAVPTANGVRFRVWSPRARGLAVVLLDGAAAGTHRSERDAGGVFDLIVSGVRPGDRYGYSIDGGPVRPDPASRFQPEGVHGPSEVVDASAFGWTDQGWRGPALADLILYELHVGTFSPEGTFAGVTGRLPYLRDLGVTAIEVMPVADFAGARNWGYDGVCLYAPARAYGGPDDLRQLVDAAHRLDIAVLLDVVYNHLGPEGAYLTELNPEYLTDREETPWGRAVNLNGPGSEMVRAFIIDNARHWIREYHLDGLRLDATSTLIDRSPRHVVAEAASAARDVSERRIVIHAEDDRNLASIVASPDAGGWGLDGFWSDDFHHSMRRQLAGDSDGYYMDYAGTSDELAQIVRQGWLFTGQHSTFHGKPRGTDPSSTRLRSSVICVQNHDQVGNRALGERLHHQIAPEAWCAASTVLLTAPMTPLLFMGQEWAASSPFQYFTDLEPGLGRLVTEGRRREFARFPEFSAPEARTRIPDPQARPTFEASRLRWEEIGEPRHATVLALYRTLVALRHNHRALGASDETSGDAFAPDGETLVVRRAGGGETFWIIAKLSGGGSIDLRQFLTHGPGRAHPWSVVMTTEELAYTIDPKPPEIDLSGSAPKVIFSRPGAVILRTTGEGPET